MFDLARWSRGASMLIAGGLVAAALTASAASGAVLTWNNPAGGSAFVPANWTPAQVPTAADVLVFGIASEYSVTFGGGASAQILVTGGGTTLVAPHTVGSLLVVSNNATLPILTVTDGRLSVPVALIADGAASSNGAIAVTGDGATLFCSAALFAGDDGNGGLDLLEGGAAVTPTFTAARLSTAVSAVIVSSGHPTATSQLTANGVAIVGDAGDASLDIIDRARMDVVGDMIIGNAATSQSVVRLVGAGVPLAKLTVTGDLHIGHSPAGGLAGEGDLLVAGGASVDVDGTTFFGNLAGGAAGFDEIAIEGDGHLTTRSLVRSLQSLLDFRGGTITINGGTLTWPSSQSLVVGNSMGSALLEMVDGAHGSLSAPGAGALLLGEDGGGEGHFALRSGSSLAIPSGLVSVTKGSLTVESGCTLDLAGGLFADDDTATIDIAGTLETGQTIIANGNVMDVVGVDALATFGAQSFIGGSPAAPDTGGTLTIALGGEVHCSSSLIIDDGGIVRVGIAGLLDLGAGPISDGGTIEMLGGTIDCGVVLMEVDALITGNGTINGRIDMSGPSSAGAVIASGLAGVLTVGDPGSGAGFDGAGGTLVVNPAGIVLRDADAAELGDVALAGGTLTLPDDGGAGGMLPAGRTLSGSGTVVGGDLQNAGTITPTGAGLTFGCFVTGATPATIQDISGTSIAFAAGGGFTGQGAIDAIVIGDGGSVITATGGLVMGDPASSSGVQLSGALHVGEHTVTLNDSTGAGLGTLTTIDGGHLVASAGGLILGPTDVLRFSSSAADSAVQAASLINVGLVESGDSAGTLTITGNYTHVAAGGPGDLRLELDAFGASAIDVTGAATLDGNLTLALVGAAPAIGTQHVILAAASITGAFDAVVLEGFPSCLDALVAIGATQVTVTITHAPCPDTDCDGEVGFADLLAALADWGPCAGCPSDVAPPPAGDGEVDFNDLLAILAGWGACDP
jgi:T5SS/PEP-CTERM-associated repeat protein